VSKLVMLRHGESTFNAEGRFTGWVDVDLTQHGTEEARGAAELFAKANLTLDVVFTSELKRAIHTLEIIQMQLDWSLPVIRSWLLNERHYGALQGLGKKEMANLYGAEQVQAWRRGYDVRPPESNEGDEYWTGNDLQYRNIPKELIPRTESLKDTVERVMKFWDQTISSELIKGREVLVVAHNNSLRAIVGHLDKMSEEDIVKWDIPTGVPLVFELDGLEPVRSYYLSNSERR